MRNDHYSPGTVQDLLQTDFVSPQTKQTLQQRLDTPVAATPSFFTQEEFVTLQAICKRLLPQPEDRQNPIDLAGILDSNLKDGKASNGWRYDVMPSDEKAYHMGLQAIEKSSQSRYGKAFHTLGNDKQDQLLQAIQQKKEKGNEWEKIPSNLFFEELMASLAEIYYGHPIGKDEIGDVSFADTKGWQHIQLNEKESREPVTINKSNK